MDMIPVGKFGSIKNPSHGAPASAVPYSWETPPEPVSASEIVRELNYDVVIAGAGLAGLSAAVRASELGLRAAVVEKHTRWSGRGGMFGSLDSKVMRARGITIDRQKFAREWIRLSGSRCREELVHTFCSRSGEAMDWLIDMAEPLGVGCGMYTGYYKGPDYEEYPGTHMFFPRPGCKYGHGPGMLVSELLYDRARELGADFFFKTPAARLEKTDERVTALIAGTPDSYIRLNAERGVILATGDISGDPEMTDRYAPLAKKPTRFSYFPVGMNTGDGHKLGLWAGGKFEDGPWPTMIHLTAYGLYPCAFLYVNRRGERFMNEDTWVQAKSVRCLSQPGGDYAWAVFDSRWMDTVERSIPIGGGQFWDLFSAVEGHGWSRDCGIDERLRRDVKSGVAITADTIEGLAAKMGVPPDALKRTVERYTQLAKNGSDDDFGKRRELMDSVDTPPFYALKWGPSLLCVVGGLETDTGMNVLDNDMRPIPGLYAAGNTAGGLYGVDYPVLLNGNSHGRALTWGYISAESCADNSR